MDSKGSDNSAQAGKMPVKDRAGVRLVIAAQPAKKNANKGA
jgi:hypothetical protein